MSHAQIIDGKAAAAALREQIKREVSGMDVPPGLAVILVGDDPASHVYVSHKIKACRSVGIQSFEARLPATARESDVKETIEAFNADPAVHGILLQLPLPAHLDSATLIQRIDPAKDVDGLTTENAGRLMADLDGLVPCTPQGCMMLIKSVQSDVTGLHAVVIGRSLLFGKPMGQLLLAENCTVTMTHSRTRDLPEVCRSADILIAAVGRANIVKSDWVKPGAIVMDVGINRLDNGRLCGDVDFEDVSARAGFITPVPGGIGPMTIACLLANTLKAARLQQIGAAP